MGLVVLQMLIRNGPPNATKNLVSNNQCMSDCIREKNRWQSGLPHASLTMASVNPKVY